MKERQVCWDSTLYKKSLRTNAGEVKASIEFLKEKKGLNMRFKALDSVWWPDTRVQTVS